MLIKPPLIFDTDLASFFSEVNRMDIVEKLYPKQMIVLPQVIYELSRAQPLLKKFRQSIDNGNITIVDLNPLGNDGQEFAWLISRGTYGSGEAACMAYARHNGGTIGSGNIRDVLVYCQKHSIGLLSFRPIIVQAVNDGIIPLADAEAIWQTVITRMRARLPDAKVEDAIEFYKNGAGAKYTLHKL